MTRCRRAASGSDAATSTWSVSTWTGRLVVLAALCLVVLADVTVFTGAFAVQPAASSNSDSVRPSSKGFDQLTSDVRRPRRKTSAGRPASCSCTCETVMVPATPVPAPQLQQQQQEMQEMQDDYHSDWTGDDHVTNGDEQTGYDDIGDQFIAGQSLVDDTHDIDRYTGNWGHGIRYPWTRLPDRMCFRDPCESDADCCRRFNLCDRSAHVCVDCWYGSSCQTEAQCCIKYPTCRLSTNRADNWGQCVDD